MNRKGISEVVSLVLLIGMGVTLALLVTTWSQRQAKETTETLVNARLRDDYCSLAGMNVNFETGKCVSLLKINITNTGDIKLVNFDIKLDDVDRDIANANPGFDFAIMPGQTKTLNIGLADNLNELMVIPYVSIEGNEVGCFSKRIVLKC